MKEGALNIAAYFIDGKPIYPALRRALNLLFNISIASFVYQLFYGYYTWLDITDYKGILNFFIKGKFFIPFSVFLVVYAITQFLAVVVFATINHIKSVKLQRQILSYEYKKNNIDEGLEAVNLVSTAVAPIDLTPELLIETYQKLRTHLNEEAYKKVEEALEKPRQSLQNNFILAFRAFIAITIFKISLPEFGWLLYSLTTIIFIVGMLALVLAYRFLDILPTIFRVFHIQAEQYVKEYLKAKAANKKN